MLAVRVCPEGPRPSAAGDNMGTQLADCNTGPAPAIVAAIVSAVDVESAEVAAAAAAAAAGTVAAAAQNTMLVAKKPTVCWTWRRHCGSAWGWTGVSATQVMKARNMRTL